MVYMVRCQARVGRKMLGVHDIGFETCPKCKQDDVLEIQGNLEICHNCDYYLE